MIVQLITKEQRIEKLTAWINEQGQWADDYASHEDSIAIYIDLFETHSLFYGEIDSEVEEEVKALLESMEAGVILDYCDIDIHYGIHCRSDEIWSMGLGEIETQLPGISDFETGVNCIFTELCKGLSKEEIEKAGSNSDYCLSGDCIYSDHSYDRISVVLRVDELLKEKGAA